MVDPFSVVAGTASLIDVCWRVGAYLGKVKVAAGKIEQDLATLSNEVDSLITVSKSIQELWYANGDQTFEVESSDARRIEGLWRDINSAIHGCQGVMGRLAVVVEDIIGKDGLPVQGKRDGLRKVLRKQSRGDEILELRQQIASHQGGIHLTLSALNLCYIRSSQKSNASNLEILSDNLDFWGFKLQHELAAIRCRGGTDGKELSSISTAAEVASQISLNKYFQTPRAVSSIFTGRETLLQDLKQSIFNATGPAHSDQTQKRFVIYGLGGSGKTEFCCKFAQDNRQSFWGVFSINASSPQSVKHTYSSIAQLAGKEPNERAAKDWLANLTHPWLLIIDNADDRDTALEDHFPEGERGLILITTRNPLNRLHGTVGPGFYHFEKLGESEANDLLLRAACEPSPWSFGARDSAAKITRHLGFLALALIQAGKAIAKRICTLNNYLEVYDRSWQRIRRLRRKSTSGHGRGDEIVNMNVYSSYEIIFRGLEATESTATQDAVQLIKMFSFFSWEDLRVDVLTTSVEHPRLQLEHDKKEQQPAKAAVQSTHRNESWTQMCQRWAVWVVTTLQADETKPTLPPVLRDNEGEVFDEDRLMDALDQLNQLSLISYQEATESYSMHPLVHRWIRERPQMTNSEQALWCQAAATTLSRSILLPPLDTTESAEALRRHLLPHVIHVLECQKSVQSRISENLKTRRYRWLVTVSQFGRLQALESAKFSLIYVQNGYFDEAEALQVMVKNFVLARLGMEHATARRITLFLAGTYYLQLRTNKAAELQQEVFRACEVHLGPDNHETLKVMDTLGASRCFQGRFREARELHERAIDRMTATLGPNHEDTLLAIDNLGRIMWRYFKYQEARNLHTKAVDGLTKLHGPTHEKTLISKENLAIAYISIGGDVLNTAHDLMVEVMEERKKKLGNEQPWTLYAICNLARVKSALGQHIEAERLMRAALPVAERNLGANHLGTLAGKTHLAQVLVRQGRYVEAEIMFNDVIQRQRYERAARDDGEHPDRILAMWYLVQCYQKHGRIADAIRICDELTEAVATIGGQGLGLQHPFARTLRERREELITLEAKSGQEGPRELIVA